jgi:hypothetical protein
LSAAAAVRATDRGGAISHFESGQRRRPGGGGDGAAEISETAVFDL